MTNHFSTHALFYLLAAANKAKISTVDMQSFIRKGFIDDDVVLVSRKKAYLNDRLFCVVSPKVYFT
ncbi:hypothetical protein [Bacillus sp. ISL-4]|uniref:hypothetical protein n=1 Tax=Bacillus sp. ISL-4 TaxID=2819125 RepID=UPI001BE77568|nr:hypothetical protein [Bacillus sp. ISL-4]